MVFGGKKIKTRKNHHLCASLLLGLGFTAPEVLVSALTGAKLGKNLLGENKQ